MRVLVLAGLITVATVPFAAASENDVECQMDDTRRAAAQQRIESRRPRADSSRAPPSRSVKLPRRHARQPPSGAAAASRAYPRRRTDRAARRALS